MTWELAAKLVEQRRQPESPQPVACRCGYCSMTTKSDYQPLQVRGSPSRGEIITASELDGIWRIGAGSIVGYRVEEKIALDDLTAVGRTSGVTGEFTVVNGVLDTAELIVDMDTFVSDRSRRDAQFRTRIIDVETYPTSTFRLTEPVTVPAPTADGDDGPVRRHRRAHFARQHETGRVRHLCRHRR